MTEDEARTLNRMSARITALQLLSTWLLHKSLKEEEDPDTLVAALLAKAQAATDSDTGRDDGFGAAFVEEFTLIVRQSEKLLAGR